MSNFDDAYVELCLAVKRITNSLNEKTDEVSMLREKVKEFESYAAVSKNEVAFEESDQRIRTKLDPDCMVIGTNIRAIRKRYSMSIEELADVLDVSSTYLSLIERGKRNITLNKLCILSNFFNMPMEHFLISNSSRSA